MKRNWFHELCDSLRAFRDELAQVGLFIWYWPKRPPAK
ncbi:hypothetical protein LCGC14_0520570 [marine sediment metagenome]|uniref:Uncharacterized protein n=1 Tax=marine sediment metagenome TaxID=412755 RepID=A0A0F9S3F9_9ZZZZ